MNDPNPSENIQVDQRPRIVLIYKQSETRDKDQLVTQMQQMPITSTIGQLARIQHELIFRADEVEPHRYRGNETNDSRLTIIFNPETFDYHWSVDPTIPTDQLVGALELIKQSLVAAQMGMMMQAQAQGIVQAKKGNGMLFGPDGQPMRRR